MCATVVEIHVPFDLKLVSVKFEAFGLAFPTLYLGFWHIVSNKTLIQAGQVSCLHLKILLLLLLLPGAGTHLWRLLNESVSREYKSMNMKNLI